MRRVAAMSVMVVTLVTLAGCAPVVVPSAAAPVSASAPAAPRGAPVDPLGASDAFYRVSLMADGVEKPFRNGHKAAIGQKALAEVWFNPYPPLTRTVLVVQVLDAATQEALDDVQVIVRYEMPEMGHGVVSQRASVHERGSHHASLNLSMIGTYLLSVEVRTLTESGSINLEIALSLSK